MKIEIYQDARGEGYKTKRGVLKAIERLDQEISFGVYSVVGVKP